MTVSRHNAGCVCTRTTPYLLCVVRSSSIHAFISMVLEDCSNGRGMSQCHHFHRGLLTITVTSNEFCVDRGLDRLWLMFAWLNIDQKARTITRSLILYDLRQYLLRVVWVSFGGILRPHTIVPSRWTHLKQRSSKTFVFLFWFGCISPLMTSRTKKRGKLALWGRGMNHPGETKANRVGNTRT